MKDVQNIFQKKRNLVNFKQFPENVEGVKDPLENVVDQPEKFENYVKNYLFGITVEENSKDKKTGKLIKTGHRVVPTMGVCQEPQSISLWSLLQGI